MGAPVSCKRGTGIHTGVVTLAHAHKRCPLHSPLDTSSGVYVWFPLHQSIRYAAWCRRPWCRRSTPCSKVWFMISMPGCAPPPCRHAGRASGIGATKSATPVRVLRSRCRCPWTLNCTHSSFNNQSMNSFNMFTRRGSLIHSMLFIDSRGSAESARVTLNEEFRDTGSVGARNTHYMHAESNLMCQLKEARAHCCARLKWHRTVVCSWAWTSRRMHCGASFLLTCQ